MIRLTLILALLPFALTAAPLPCAPSTFDTYLALTEGCTAGTFVLSDFSFSIINSSGLASLPTAESFSVAAGPNVNGFGIRFSGPFAVAGAESITLLFVYTMTATTNLPGGFQLDAVTEFPPTPAGRFEVSTELVWPMDTANVRVFHEGGNDFVLSQTVGLPGVTRIVVRNTVRLEANDGDASFESFSNATTNVPEPSSWGLMLSGLAIAGWRLRTSRAGGN